MTATQTMSASLAVLLCSASPVLADDDAEPQPPGEVQPQPPPGTRAGSRAIELMPKRKPTGTFEIGAGYSTDDGFVASARIAQPRMFGSDKGLSMSAELTQRWQEFLVRYDDPTLFDSNVRLRGDLFNRTKLYPGFKREATGGELSFAQELAPHLDVFIGYKIEEVEVTPTDDTRLFRSRDPVDRLWRGGLIGAWRAGVSYSTIDRAERFYPRRGTSVGATIEWADQRFGSDLDYVRTDSWLAHHRPLGPFTLHVGSRVSSITDTAPLSERLHFDGSSDIRGYAPGAVGPRDAEGNPTGGNLLWTARGELEAPLVGDLSVAGFVDAGGLYAAWGKQTAASAGYGVIWRSPLGPLRFDVAYPLDGSGKPHYIFGIGGMF